MTTSKGLKLQQAAKELNIGPTLLKKMLHDRNIFSQQKPRLEYIKKGYFIIDIRSFFMQGTHIRRHYTVVLVTGTGLAFLRDLIDAVDQTRQVLHAERPGLSSVRHLPPRPPRLHVVDTGVKPTPRHHRPPKKNI